ncbi:hypothetical protein [Sphingomonas bisphenolicum]
MSLQRAAPRGAILIKQVDAAHHPYCGSSNYGAGSSPGFAKSMELRLRAALDRSIAQG